MWSVLRVLVEILVFTCFMSKIFHGSVGESYDGESASVQ